MEWGVIPFGIVAAALCWRGYVEIATSVLSYKAVRIAALAAVAFAAGAIIGPIIVVSALLVLSGLFGLTAG